MRIFRLLLLLIALLPLAGTAQRFRAVVPYVEQNGKFMVDVRSEERFSRNAETDL